MDAIVFDRSAYVKIGGVCSELFKITSGVPQGSVLGPMIFILFINDICNTLKSSTYLYADDLKFYRVITTRLDCVALQTDIDSLLKWCHFNGMEANFSKCNVISFNRLRSPIMFDYTIGEEQLNRSTAVKDLGILIDNKLKFTEHISLTIAKAFAMVGFVKRNTQSFNDIYCLKALYCSLIRSILEYGVQVWAPYHTVHINRIERVQKCFLRYALRKLNWRDRLNLPSYEDRCMLLSLPTLSSRRVTLQRMLVFDLLTNKIDCADLIGKLRFNAPIRSTRNTDFLRRSSHRTLYGINNPFDVCCLRFNEVADVFDFNVSKTVFKHRISN